MEGRTLQLKYNFATFCSRVSQFRRLFKKPLCLWRCGEVPFPRPPTFLSQTSLEVGATRGLITQLVATVHGGAGRELAASERSYQSMGKSWSPVPSKLFVKTLTGWSCKESSDCVPFLLQVQGGRTVEMLTFLPQTAASLPLLEAGSAIRVAVSPKQILLESGTCKICP